MPIDRGWPAVVKGLEYQGNGGQLRASRGIWHGICIMEEITLGWRGVIMVKTIGFLLGTLLLVDGVTAAINPRWGFEVWEHSLKRYMPKPVNEITHEYSHLSDSAIRYLTAWQVLAALALLYFAARARD